MAATKTDRVLRKLAGEAWRRELERELQVLDHAFAAWRQGKLDPFKLSDVLHEFDRGPSRRLRSYYARVPARACVAQAVARGLLAPGDLPAELREDIARVAEVLHPRG